VIDYVAASTPEQGRWTVAAGWAQGRGAWGGLVIAALLRSAETLIVDPAQQLRAVTCQLLAPIPVGTVDVRPHLLRVGSATTGVRVDAVDGSGAVLATLTGVWGSDRVPDVDPDYAIWGALTSPQVDEWQSIPVVAVGPPIGPEFSARLTLRPVSGYPGEGVVSTLGWVGLPDAGPEYHYDAAALVGLVDAWWPGAITILGVGHPMATISFSAHVVCDPALVRGAEPLLHEGFVTYANGGFSSEVRRLWSADGQLLVDSMQSVAIIR
jgi:hypothetical protein